MSSISTISRPGGADLALLALAAIIWASAFSAIKVAVYDVGPVWTAALRVTIGFMALLPIAMWKGIQWPAARSPWTMIVVIAALNMVIPFALISWGLQEVESGIAALLMGTTPFMAMVLGHFFTSDEKINLYKVFGVILGLCGILVVVGPSMVLGLGSAKFSSQVTIICGAWCYVIAGFIMRRVDMKPLDFTVIALGAGSVMLILSALIMEGVPDQLPANRIMLALLWLGVFPTGFTYLLRFYLVKKVGVGTFALAMNTIPVFGIIFGSVFLGEAVTIETMIALSLVIGGLLVARLGSPKFTKPQEGV